MNHEKIEERFEDRNRAYFFQDLFNGSSAENCAIANEILRLCSVLPHRYKRHFTDAICALLNSANEHRNDAPMATLNEVYCGIQSKHLLTAQNYIVKAFLSVQIQRVSYNIERYDQYKALTLAVVTHLSFKGEHESKIERLCNELRQYALGKREQLAAYLPDVLRYDFEFLIDELIELEALEVLQHSRVKNQISNIRVPFRDSYENREGFTRTIGTREFKKEGNLQRINPESLDDDTGESVIEIKELTFTNKAGEKGQSWEEEEALSATAPSLSVVSSNNFVKSEQITLMLKAKAINERIRKKKMFLTSDIYRMTSFELRQLVHHCVDAHQKNSSERDIACALLLMLFLGNSFDELVQTKLKKVGNSAIGVKRRFQLPTHKLRDEIRPLVPKVQSDYVIPLPINLISQLQNMKFKNLNVQDLKQYLSNLNKTHKTHLTLSKISAYLSQALQANGVDCTIIDLITGYSPNNQPARFYTHIPKALTTFKSYISHIEKASGNDYLQKIIVSYIAYPKLGSPLYINEAILRSLFTHMNDDLKQLIQQSQHHYTEQIHNLMLLRLQIILGLVTGYRPVEGWFGYVHDIHFSTGEYRIAEKERHLSYSGRVVLLPPTALSALREYLTYCEKAAIFYSETHKELYQRYRHSLESRSPFCFYRYQERIQEATPSTFAQHVDPIFPLPTNWTRHYLRSFLFAQKFSDELIAAWMGHIHSNQLPFSQFSQLSRAQLKAIQQALEDHLHQLLAGELQ